MTAAPASRLTDWLHSALSLQPAEGARVLLMIVYSAATVGGVLTIGITISDTLFIAGQPPEAFPYLLILPAAFIIPSLLLYNRIAARFNLLYVIIGSDLLLLAATIVFRTLLATPYGSSFAVVIGLYLFIELAYMLVILQFWSLAGLVFNPREAKRLFGLIATGGTVANIVAGLSLTALVGRLGVENLLWIVATALGVCVGCVVLTRRWLHRADSPPHSTQRTAPPERRSLGQDLRAISRSPLLLGIGAFTCLISLLINLGGFAFWRSLQINFEGRPTELAVYLGAFQFVGGVAGFFVQAYLTGRLMRRFGVFAALALFPLGMALSAAASLITGGALWAMTGLRIMDPMLRRTVTAAAVNVLYLPTPPEVRERAKELFEIVYAAAFGLAGAALLILQNVPGWNFLDLTVLLLGLALVWLALTPWAHRQYTQALTDRLKRRVLEAEHANIGLDHEPAVRVVLAAFQHRDDSFVLHALELIVNEPPARWNPYVAPLLRHNSVTVRLQALRHLARAGNREYAEPVSELLTAPEAEVRAGAIAAYGAMLEPIAVTRLTLFLADADPQVRGAAVAVLLNTDEIASRGSALSALTAMLASTDAAQRAAAAIGRAPRAGLHTQLIPLLNDPERVARVSALRAAGALMHPDLVPPLLNQLGDRATAFVAAEALARYPVGIESELSAALSDPRLGPHIPRILQKLGRPEAVATLCGHFTAPNDALRSEVYRGLAHLRANGVHVAITEIDVRRAIADELRGGYAWRVALADLGADGKDGLLEDALQARLKAALDRVFYLLILLYPRNRSQIERVRQALEMEPGSTRAMAVELLDNLAERAVKELLLPLVEAPMQDVLELAHERFNLPRLTTSERLAELAGSADPWLRACTLFRIGTLRRTELVGSVRAMLEAEDKLLRETAHVANRLLNG